MSHFSAFPPSSESFRRRPAKGGRGASVTHDSAEQHVTGAAQYVDDIPELARTLHAAIGKSPVAKGTLTQLDLSQVCTAAGVVDVVTIADMPAVTDIGPVYQGDPILAGPELQFHGQALFAVAAATFIEARKAVALAAIQVDEQIPTLTLEQALASGERVRPDHMMVKGDAKKALASAPNTLTNTLYNKGQEHFYLESQVSYAVPTDDGGMTIYTSSQHPSEVQKLVAEVLGIAMHKVTVLVRRMGGGFGGKETQAAPWACLAAVLAVRNKRPVKLRLDRQDDMVLTGKRHDFFSRWTVGFDDEGQLIGADIHLAGLCGFSPDLSDAIVDRAMFHVDNAYNFPAMAVLGQRCKTNTVSNTAFRGFGGPQGMIVGEAMMDDIARATGLDPLDVRLKNLYQNGDKTHYGQPIEDFHIERLMTQLERECEYRQRRHDITEFNQQHPYLKRGLALTPVRFGISFTVQHLNQAGALINIYTDGSIQINHGGTEMGQGLFTKVAQVVANEFSVDLDYVQVTATATDKVPNTSPTAASSGSDLNGKAAQAACQTIKERLVDLAVEHFGVAPDDVHFINNHVVVGVGESAQWFTFAEFVQLAYEQRVSLSATGYYRTPKIFYDRDTASGRPFYYYALGASCSEVEIDTLTGEYRILRTDILHDVGASLSPAIDIGQIEGGFVQGMGWLTTEELTWDAKGKLASASAATYKIPTSMDVPSILNVRLFDQPNAEETIYNSKAVGEPPLMHGISVWCALRDAAASVANYAINPPLDTPATPERVLAAVMACQAHNEGLVAEQIS